MNTDGGKFTVFELFSLSALFDMVNRNIFQDRLEKLDRISWHDA